MTQKKVSFGPRPKATVTAIDPAAADAFVAGGAEMSKQPATLRGAGTEPQPATEKVKFKRLTIDIEPALHRQLKTRAAEEDTTIAEVARRLLQEWAYR